MSGMLLVSGSHFDKKKKNHVKESKSNNNYLHLSVIHISRNTCIGLFFNYASHLDLSFFYISCILQETSNIFQLYSILKCFTIYNI